MKSTITISPDALTQIEDFDLDAMTLENASSRRVTFTDEATGQSFTLGGEGLKVRGGVVVKGHIDQLTISNDDTTLLSAKHFDLNASNLPHSNLAEMFIATKIQIVAGNNRIVGSSIGDAMTAGDGNDRMFGGDGDDFLLGGDGNDRITGGKGADTFLFDNGARHDIITDFDAIGGVGNQDFIGVSFDEVVIRSDHGNTIIDLGAGDMLTLLHVNKHEIDQSDFTTLF